MAKVVADMSMSLDGFVADPHDQPGPLFNWFGNGPVPVPSHDPRWSFQVHEPSARHLREALTNVKALVCGRRLFDLTGGWGGNHPLGVPVFVVTHEVPAGRRVQAAPHRRRHRAHRHAGGDGEQRGQDGSDHHA